MQHLRWSLTGFESVHLMHGATTERSQRTKYSIRHLRYWFVYRALVDLHTRLNRPLRILEVGVDQGNMLCFASGRRINDNNFVLPNWIARWDGLDTEFDPILSAPHAYSELIIADIQTLDKDWCGGRSYDAVIVPHMEHLFDPEGVMRCLLSVVAPGGLLMGGSPTMPSALAAIHERQLRRRNADPTHDVRINKHISIVTPHRIRRFARAGNLIVDLIAGSFFCRASGSFLENSAIWLYCNLLWGALFPTLGGELYFSLRKRNDPLMAEYMADLFNTARASTSFDNCMRPSLIPGDSHHEIQIDSLVQQDEAVAGAVAEEELCRPGHANVTAV